MTEHKTIFANNLRLARKTRNFTQQKVGDLIGIGRSRYGHYEEGIVEPSFSMLLKICEVLRIRNIKRFLSDEDFEL